MQKCRDWNNFHCAYAILAGLNDPAISRLKLSWERVPKRLNQKLEQLSALFDMSHNFKQYREALYQCSAPVVPYLAIMPKDLTSLEELPTLIKGTVSSFQLLNFPRESECDQNENARAYCEDLV